ncbi:MAG: toprim domain-containing protein [Ignavibacteriaceae bacterium]|nr:toprim domain-containing protein [Ignavibacteriaceae bacterium]
MNNKIQEIKNRLPILELLNRLGIMLNSSGFIHSIYKKDKTPSMKIYPKSNSYFCFATNKGGDVITLYSDYYNIDLSQTIKELSSICGISSFEIAEREQPETTTENQSSDNLEMLPYEIDLFEERRSIISIENDIPSTDAEILALSDIINIRKSIQSKIFTALFNYSISIGYDEAAFNYLTSKKRGLTEQTIKEFKIFTLQNIEDTVSFLRDSFPQVDLAISGLFKNNYFLFAKHRIIIPYIENGKIAYLRGRYFFNGNTIPEKCGKYTGCNNWSFTLSPKRFYNIDIVKRLKPFEHLLISEGEFDCIAAAQNRINSIGIAGVSNFPKEQIDRLKHFKIYLSFDNDEAGVKAINEIASLFEQPLRIVRLTEYKDLTEYFSNEYR